MQRHSVRTCTCQRSGARVQHALRPALPASLACPAPPPRRAIVDGLGGVLFQYPFRVPAYYALILRSLTVLEGLVGWARCSHGGPAPA